MLGKYVLGGSDSAPTALLTYSQAMDEAGAQEVSDDLLELMRHVEQMEELALAGMENETKALDAQAALEVAREELQTEKDEHARTKELLEDAEAAVCALRDDAAAAAAVQADTDAELAEHSKPTAPPVFWQRWRNVQAQLHGFTEVLEQHVGADPVETALRQAREEGVDA